MLLAAPPPPTLEAAAWRTAAVALLMAMWWLTEAIPIPATALLPLVLLPILGVMSFEDAAASYANPIIFLFLGGFMIAEAMQRWNLHRRVALLVIVRIGTRPIPLIGGFMVAAAFLSMWVSNTATAVMMLPIGLSVITLIEAEHEGGHEAASRDPNFAVALMLGIAYACSIGGLATLIGTPPNAILAGFMAERYGVHIGFGEWMLVGLPIALLGLPLTWYLLTRRIYPVRLRSLPGSRETISRQLEQLGAPSRGEWLVALVFTATAVAWIIRPLLQRWMPGLTDAGIAIGAAVLLFALPVDAKKSEFILNWATAKRLPWNVLILFGGGLSLAAAIAGTGLADWIGGLLAGLRPMPVLSIIVVTCALVLFLTELTSNTATAAVFLPILASLALQLGENPLVLAVPAALAASCAFMMPVATPPNAVVYGSGYVTLPQMVRAGVLLNMLFIMLTSLVGYLLVLIVFGPAPGVAPAWAR